MLTSAGQTTDTDRRRTLGLAACLTKPVKQSELRNAILKALADSSRKASGALTTVADPNMIPERRLRILVAEDNLVNQRLACRLLEKRGHEVIIVNNGLEAVEALEHSDFDLALMDVQMPEMSGYDVTNW